MLIIQLGRRRSRHWGSSCPRAPRAVAVRGVPPLREAAAPPLRRVGRRHGRHGRHRPRALVPPRRGRAAGSRARGPQPRQARGRRGRCQRRQVPRHAGAEMRTFVLDFAADGLAAKVAAFGELIRDLDVRVLVNNAGAFYPYARYFHEVDEALMRNMVRLNVEATTRVTHAVLPGMVERGRGAIVNIGSGSASILPSCPLHTVYAATKAFVDQFSRSLYVEYKSKGIDVQCQAPMYVAAKMASTRNPSFLAPSPESYARAAVRYIGDEPRCSPYWPHAVWKLVSLVPGSVADRVILRKALDGRAKGRAKDARKKKTW